MYEFKKIGFIDVLPENSTKETFYNWRAKYSGLLPNEMKKLRSLEEENTRLKKLVADLSLDKEMLQEISEKSFKAC